MLPFLNTDRKPLEPMCTSLFATTRLPFITGLPQTGADVCLSPVGFSTYCSQLSVTSIRKQHLVASNLATSAGALPTPSLGLLTFSHMDTP